MVSLCCIFKYSTEFSSCSHTTEEVNGQETTSRATQKERNFGRLAGGASVYIHDYPFDIKYTLQATIYMYMYMYVHLYDRQINRILKNTCGFIDTSVTQTPCLVVSWRHSVREKAVMFLNS